MHFLATRAQLSSIQSFIPELIDFLSPIAQESTDDETKKRAAACLERLNKRRSKEKGAKPKVEAEIASDINTNSGDMIMEDMNQSGNIVHEGDGGS